MVNDVLLLVYFTLGGNSSSMRLISWDSALVSIGGVDPVPTPLVVPDVTGGVHFALVGNIWNTNYPDSSFEGGTFRLSVEVTPRYPFEAPKIRFLTKVYHPNIDTGGRICLDTLKMPPRGTWVPSMNM